MDAMNNSLILKTAAWVILLLGAALIANTGAPAPHSSVETVSISQLKPAIGVDVIRDDNIQLCQGFENPYSGASLPCGCVGVCKGGCGVTTAVLGADFGYAQAAQAAQPHRPLQGVDQFSDSRT